MQSFVDPMLDKALAMSDEELKQCVEEEASGTAGEQTKAGSFSFLAACAAVSRERSFLRDTVITIVLAARDTTAMTLTWCLYELAKNPTVVAELRTEIVTKLGMDASRRPTYEDLKSMPFLQRVLNETLRLYPSIPYNAREAARDTSLPRGGGKDGMSSVGVRKGTLIYFCPHILRKHTFPLFSQSLCDANLSIQIYVKISIPWTIQIFRLLRSFIPIDGRNGDRHLGHTCRSMEVSGSYSRNRSFDRAVLYPGNCLNQELSRTILRSEPRLSESKLGPRTCIGQQFALVEMSYVLVRLFQRYSRVELRPLEDEHRRGQKVSSPWVRREDATGPELAEAYMRSRPSMASEITLNPRNEVHITFIK